MLVGCPPEVPDVAIDSPRDVREAIHRRRRPGAGWTRATGAGGHRGQPCSNEFRRFRGVPGFCPFGGGKNGHSSLITTSVRQSSLRQRRCTAKPRVAAGAPGNVESPPSSGFPLLRRTPTGFPQPDAPVRLGRKFPTQGAPAATLGFALNAFGVRVAAESRSSVHEPSGVRREVSKIAQDPRAPYSQWTPRISRCCFEFVSPAASGELEPCVNCEPPLGNPHLRAVQAPFHALVHRWYARLRASRHLEGLTAVELCF